MPTCNYGNVSQQPRWISILTGKAIQASFHWSNHFKRLDTLQVWRLSRNISTIGCNIGLSNVGENNELASSQLAELSVVIWVGGKVRWWIVKLVSPSSYTIKQELKIND